MFPDSKLTAFLKAELERVRAEHTQHVADLKNTYESMLASAIQENARLRDDNARLQRVAVPEVKHVVLPSDPTPPPPPPLPPAKPRTWQEYVNQEVASWKVEKNFVGSPGQPITPKEKEDAPGQT